MFKILDSDERLEQKKAEQQFDAQTECDEIVALVNQSQYVCVLCKKYKIIKGMRRGKKQKSQILEMKSTNLENAKLCLL